ncbi:Fic family protein [Roseburia sp. AM59-24XD]|jgi:Fic family protein|uniref:Fic family protein n=1 Tax=Roseburia sp. AM59-24XD TaxID=2293138 RepID=UPI000E48C652|nr:Fic family protein [Roseburia sp. AM59-24XD]RHP88077.1 Fic family protein [Roseburia sp. AM59-24XD]
MRQFDYRKKWEKLLTPKTVSYLAQIHEFKGEQTLFIEAQKDTLTQLVKIARIQSTEASNKIEGIYTSDERLKALVQDSTRPRTRNEREIAGYRDVLNTIHESYDYIPLKPSMILQLHRDLFKFEGYDIGGKYKAADNIIEEEDDKGNKFVRFQPMPAWETPEAMDILCDAFDTALATEQIDPLLLIPMFVLDFLCVHPFNDGNGRMSRLLTLLLMHRSGYIVGKYISIEKLIEKTKEEYYESLQQSSFGWYEEQNDYEPFVHYMLGIIVAAYREFSSRVRLLTTEKMSKSERVREIIRGTVGTITKSEILERCPDISQMTVQRALAELLETEQIVKIGGGRYTKYTWNNDKEGD